MIYLQKSKILEIKAFVPDLEKIKYQLYYESNGREIYILQTEWNKKLKRGLIFTLYKVYILNNKDNIEKNIIPNKKSIERIISRKVGTYFHTSGNRWSLGCMTFKEKEEFNYKYIKEYIIANRINIKKLANNIEVSETTIRNWINGKSRPYVWNAIAICVWLNIDENNVIIKK